MKWKVLRIVVLWNNKMTISLTDWSKNLAKSIQLYRHLYREVILLWSAAKDCSLQMEWKVRRERGFTWSQAE